jgi:hypothetical protein
MQVDYYKYKKQDFTCKHCGWQGKGDELQHGAFSEMHAIGDLECPKCFEMVAFWQAPLIEDVEDEEVENGK